MRKRELIFRDDDIYLTKSICSPDRYYYNFEKFKKVHHLLKGYRHSLAIIASEIDNYPLLTEFLLQNKNDFDFQIHGWNHDDYTELDNPYSEIKKAKDKIEKTFGVECTIFYAPYNHRNDKLRKACQKLKLELNEKFVSPEQFLEGKMAKTLYFHYWSDSQVDNLKKIL